MQHGLQWTTWSATIAELQKKLPVFKPGKWSVNANRKIALYGHDAKTMKQFTLHFENSAQCDSLDSIRSEKYGFLSRRVSGTSTMLKCNLVDQAELDQEPGQDEPELCFSILSARPSLCSTHVLLPGHMLPRGARSFDVSVNLAVGKEKARCWGRNEVYAEDRAHPLLPLGRLANLLDLVCVGEWSSFPEHCLRRKFWEKAAQDPKMSAYLHHGVKAKIENKFDHPHPPY